MPDEILIPIPFRVFIETLKRVEGMRIEHHSERFIYMHLDETIHEIVVHEGFVSPWQVDVFCKKFDRGLMEFYGLAKQAAAALAKKAKH